MHIRKAFFETAANALSSGSPKSKHEAREMYANFDINVDMKAAKRKCHMTKYKTLTAMTHRAIPSEFEFALYYHLHIQKVK